MTTQTITTKTFLRPPKYWRIGNDQDDQENQQQEQQEQITPENRRYYIGAVIFTSFTLILFLYWAAFVLLNTPFFHGYARPGDPSGEFRSARYGWDWWQIWLLTLNGLLPLLFAFALTESKYPEYGKAHGYLGALLILVNLCVFVVLSYRWCAICNREGSPHNTACNAYDYCCVYFGGTETKQWCPNDIPCTPNVVSGDLSRNGEYFQHWLFSLLFFLIAVINLGINRDMREYGIFKSR